ncbi:CIA30 family protein [Ascidiimonas sp. W6]|uniref:CIA30 family protein n=1 Tax=Ascidiimonas meishanensis TaxID=3128903 RepID=UPI0030ECB106
MKIFIHFFILLMMLPTLTIFDFHKNANLDRWNVVDDVVMGGRSNGNFFINENGHGVFKGNVSLENNGGFSSVRYRPESIETQSYKSILIRLKGDGNRYQFRIKSNTQDYYSYISYFETNTDWQIIEINLKDMYPTFRGRKLDMPKYSDNQISEIAFLIGNKKAQDFELVIDKITLQ